MTLTTTFLLVFSLATVAADDPKKRTMPSRSRAPGRLYP